MSDFQAILVCIGIVAAMLQAFTIAIARDAIRFARHDGWVAGYEACRKRQQAFAEEYR